MFEIGLGAGVFTGIVMTLVLMILAARARLVSTGEIDIVINGERHVRASAGRKLAMALAEDGIYLPAACGGRGTCGQCRITVLAGGGSPVPVERSLLSKRDLRRGVRLACQISVHDTIRIDAPPEILGVRKFACTVRSTRNVATLMKEIVLELPAGEALDFQAGAYVQVTCPPHETRFQDFDVAPEYRTEWDRMNLWPLVVSSDEETARAYSIASHPGEHGIVMLIVRIATPPPGASSVPPGIVSSWLFRLRPGDPVEIAGPHGSFRATESEREMILVGGGAGMAPMRSILLDQLLGRRTTRKISYWYGARNLRELFYREELDRLQENAENFEWHVALSEPGPSEDWTGHRGFIHEVLYERYLKDHPAPEECEYYLCGPPMMIRAVCNLLDGLGVDPERVHVDDFGT